MTGAVTVLDRGCDLTQVRWRLEMLTAWGACTNQLALPLLSVRCNAKVVASVVSSSQAAKAPTLSPTLDPPSSTYVQPKGPVRSPSTGPLVSSRCTFVVDPSWMYSPAMLHYRYIAVTLPLHCRYRRAVARAPASAAACSSRTPRTTTQPQLGSAR